MNSRPVKRIEDVMGLRVAQFPEDAGPMAHPIRPDSYIKMDNFYTVRPCTCLPGLPSDCRLPILSKNPWLYVTSVISDVDLSI